VAWVFISVGSNIEPEKNVAKAVRALADRVVLRAISTVYLNEPFDRVGDPPFYNCVIEIETNLPPDILKREVLERVEAELGRVRSEDKHAPRTIDLDIIVYVEGKGAGEGFSVVDSDIAKRAYLAVPLAEIAPSLVVGEDGRSAAEIALGFENHNMVSLFDYTKALRRSVFGG